MLKKCVYSFLLLVIFSFCSKTKKDDLANSDRPNILFIISDDQGWGDLSLNGNTNLSTPNIDRIGREGAVFNRFFVCPVCSPTRAEFLTGRYHARGGVYSTSAGGERLDLDETTIAEIFKRNGYHTGAYGKWHNGMQYPYHPNGRGFDDYYGFCSGHWGNYFDPMLEHNGKIVKGNGFIIDDLTDHAMDFMEEHKNEPFFCYVPYNTPHSPLQVPDEYWDRFKVKEIAMQYPDTSMENIKYTRAALALCENIDWNVGRLLSKLEELEIMDNTIVIYLSDNGPNSWRWNGGMKGRKGSTDEGGVRSPLVMRWGDKIPPGTQIDQIGSALDFLPTLAELAEIEYHTEKPLDGLSLKSVILGEGEVIAGRTIFRNWRERVSVRTQQFLLDHSGHLFDMEEDPGQKSDVAEKYPDVAEKLREAQSDFIENVSSELPEKDLRSFPLGHPDYVYTQVPARDAIAHGGIERSSRWPNCSYFTNWTTTDDSLTWDVDVLANGDFEVDLYYTCPKGQEGSSFEISLNGSTLEGTIDTPHDSPPLGIQYDREPRGESYDKDFKALNVGKIQLEKGRGTLVIKATNIAHQSVMDFRLLMFRRI